MRLSTNKMSIPGIAIAVLWFLYVLLDYLFNHPYYTQGIVEFAYWGTIVLTLGVFAVFASWQAGWKKPWGKFNVPQMRGWHWVLLFWITTWIILYSFLSKNVPGEQPGQLVVHFTGKSLLLQLALSFITLAGFATGRWILRRLEPDMNYVSFALLSIATGWSVIGTLLFFHAAVFPVQGIVFLILMGGLIAWQYEAVGRLLKRLLVKPVALKGMTLWKVLPLYILMLYLSASWIDAVKLVPVGYDGLNLYGNLARNLGEGGRLLGGYQPYNWSLFMSLGWHLFDAPAVGFLLSVLPGWLALAVTFRLARLWLPVSASWLVATLLAIVPMMVYQMGSTEKIDLAFLFFQLSVLLLLLEFWKVKKKQKAVSVERNDDDRAMVFCWGLAGWLMGYAFGIKLTAFFAVFGLLLFLFYKHGNRLAFAGSFFTGIGLFFLFRIQKLAGAPSGWIYFDMICAALTVVGLYILYRQFSGVPDTMKRLTKKVIVFFLFIVVGLSPWLLANLVKTQTVSVEKIIQGKDNTPALKVNQSLMTQKAQAEAAGKEIAFKNTTRREELDRYFGFKEGFIKYIGNFYRLTMSTEIRDKIYVDISFLFFLLLPFFMFFNRYKKTPGEYTRVGVAAAVLLLVTGFSVYGVWADKTNLPAALEAQAAAHPPFFAGIFSGILIPVLEGLFRIGSIFKNFPILFGNTYIVVTVSISLILLLLLYFLIQPSFTRMPQRLKAVGGFLTGYTLLWMWFGSGIPWYGILAFPLMLILITYLFKNKENHWQNYFNTAAGIALTLSIVLRFSSADKENMGDNTAIFNMPNIAYSTGMVTTERSLLENMSDIYVQGVNAVNQNPDGKVYRVGTFMHYFIKNNHQRVFEDNQLGYYDDVLKTVDKPLDFIRVLKESGFRYILFNPKDINFDKTPEQTFRKKFESFWRVLASASNVRVVATNNIVADPNGEMRIQRADGSVMAGRYGIRGKIIQYGDLAVVEILQ